MVTVGNIVFLFVLLAKTTVQVICNLFVFLRVCWRCVPTWILYRCFICYWKIINFESSIEDWTLLQITFEYHLCIPPLWLCHILHVCIVNVTPCCCSGRGHTRNFGKFSNQINMIVHYKVIFSITHYPFKVWITTILDNNMKHFFVA